MPDPKDKAQAILEPVEVEDSLKANAWDVYHSEDDEAKFTEKLKGINIPLETKAALWDSKFPQRTPAAAAPPKPRLSPAITKANEELSREGVDKTVSQKSVTPPAVQPEEKGILSTLYDAVTGGEAPAPTPQPLPATVQAPTPAPLPSPAPVQAPSQPATPLPVAPVTSQTPIAPVPAPVALPPPDPRTVASVSAKNIALKPVMGDKISPDLAAAIAPPMQPQPVAGQRDLVTSKLEPPAPQTPNIADPELARTLGQQPDQSHLVPNAPAAHGAPVPYGPGPLNTGVSAQQQDEQTYGPHHVQFQSGGPQRVASHGSEAPNPNMHEVGTVLPNTEEAHEIQRENQRGIIESAGRMAQEGGASPAQVEQIKQEQAARFDKENKMTLDTPLMPIGDWLHKQKEQMAGYDPHTGQIRLDGLRKEHPAFADFMHAVGSHLMYGPEEDKNPSVSEAVGEAALNTVLDLGQFTGNTVQGFTTPKNGALLGATLALPIIGAPKMLQALVTAGFAADQSAQAVKQIMSAYEKVKAGDKQGASKDFADGMASFIFALEAGHGVKGEVEGHFHDSLEEVLYQDQVSRGKGDADARAYAKNVVDTLFRGNQKYSRQGVGRTRQGIRDVEDLTQRREDEKSGKIIDAEGKATEAAPEEQPAGQ